MMAEGKNKGTDKRTDKMMTPVPDTVKVGNIVLNIAKHINVFVRIVTKRGKLYLYCYKRINDQK
jgi:hypothetical protein